MYAFAFLKYPYIRQYVHSKQAKTTFGFVFVWCVGGGVFGRRLSGIFRLHDCRFANTYYSCWIAGCFRFWNTVLPNRIQWWGTHMFWARWRRPICSQSFHSMFTQTHTVVIYIYIYICVHIWSVSQTPCWHWSCAEVGAVECWLLSACSCITIWMCVGIAATVAEARLGGKIRCG